MFYGYDVPLTSPGHMQFIKANLDRHYIALLLEHKNKLFIKEFIQSFNSLIQASRWNLLLGTLLKNSPNKIFPLNRKAYEMRF